MTMDLVMLLGGGALLYFGAEWLVGGAAGIARSLGINALVVGLTVVAYGTSAPEIVVGVSSAAGGHPEIALGNVLGSNVANLGLILGLTALLQPTPVDGSLRGREIPVLVLTALAVPLLLLDGVVERWEGAMLVVGAVVYTGAMVRAARADSVREANEAAAVTADAADAAGGAAPGASRRRQVGLAVGGLGTLILGGHLFVEGATGAASALGISERVVGLTVVAVGTSLPELATSLIAAYRGHSDIAVGNVVGSNIFNVLLCLGAAAIARPVVVPLSSALPDLVALVAFTVVGAFMMRTERTLRRWEAAILAVGYVAFVAVVASSGP